jgi:lysozyme family protein
MTQPEKPRRCTAKRAGIAATVTAIIAAVVALEGGYVDHPRDPGGATNMGITHRTLADWRGKAVSKQDVRNLTKAEAMQIYRANYWNKVRGDDLPDGLDYVAMDGAVNSGPRRGAEWLQAALGVKVDGAIGAMTIAAARSADPATTINQAMDIRLAFLKWLNTWGTFGKGWSRRVSEVRAEALSMAAAPAPRPREVYPAPTPPKPAPAAPAPVSGGLAAFFAAILRLFKGA